MRVPLLCLSLLALPMLPGSTAAQSAASADTSSQTASTVALPAAYDVISVRPHRQEDQRVGSYWRTSPSGFTAANVPVRSLITSAYNVIMPEQITGLPGWAQTENFDIEAKFDPENAEAVTKLRGDDRQKENSVLMQALLADRFRLKARVEQKELPVYNLVVAKGGPKIKQADASLPTGYGMGLGTLHGKAMAIAALCAGISHSAGRLVIDKTSLTGNYEIDLTWAWNDDPNSTAPSLFSALEEQLGLKLEPAKAPLDVVVIDHIERPTEN